MTLYLINPCNTLTSMAHNDRKITQKYRIWKPLGLLYVAGLTPSDWSIRIIDENRAIPDYSSIEKPDLVGITAFTSQSGRAYEIAQIFRDKGVTVVMGGIHATMRSEEALRWVDAVVLGEAENVWGNVIEDFRAKKLLRVYDGLHADLGAKIQVKHDLLTDDYFFGSIQTTRGCPLNCVFCSVSAFNGKEYRFRPIPHVIQELQAIRENYVLIVDDNFIGVSKNHLSRAKDLLRAIIDAKIRKIFVTQVTLNIADDEEFLVLAKKAGLRGVFIGFETPQREGLLEIKKKFNIREVGQIRGSVDLLRKHKITVLGSFIMGLDIDRKGIGSLIGKTALDYGIDVLNLMFLTPLPGTQLWDRFHSEGRIPYRDFPADWKNFTLSLPVATYEHLSWTDLYEEMDRCFALFYSNKNIWLRVLRSVFVNRTLANVLLTAISNINYRSHLKIDREIFRSLDNTLGRASSESSTNEEKACAKS
jgi:radical SAM superfamily enzyme YgiQ (UPF0313 family)